jgi:chlorite dismutase
MTKRSQYQIDREDESEGEGRGAIRPGGQKYIFIYPFWKTRPGTCCRLPSASA